MERIDPEPVVHAYLLSALAEAKRREGELAVSSSVRCRHDDADLAAADLLRLRAGRNAPSVRVQSPTPAAFLGQTSRPNQPECQARECLTPGVINCHVERSRDISRYFRNNERFLDFARNDKEAQAPLQPEYVAQISAILLLAVRQRVG